MVASLLELKLLSLANRAHLRSRDEGLALLVGIGLVVLALVGIAALADAGASTTAELRRAATLAIGSIVVLGFWLLPFVFRVDDGLDPRSFALFGLRPLPLAAGLALAGLIGVPALLLVVGLGVHVTLWAREGPGPGLMAFLSALLILAACVIGAQLAAAIASNGLILRNLGGILALAVVAAATPLAAMLAILDWAASGSTALRRIADWLAWLPFAAPWAAPGDIAAGNAGAAWLRILLAAATVGLLWLAWLAVVRHSLHSRERVRTERTRVGLGVFEALPDTATGVVAARSIVYWMRDPRYVVPALILPLVPLVLAASFLIAGIPASAVAWLAVPVVCLLFGWGIHNDLALDGTAFWLHVVTAVPGRADRWGRVVPPLVIGLAIAVFGSWLTAVLMADDDMFVPLLSLSVFALTAALGVGSAASAIAPYPAVAPGDSPFAQPQYSGGGEPLKQGVSLLIAVLLCVPVGGIMALGLLGDPALVPIATALGYGLGPALLVIGIEIGAAVVWRRAPELNAFLQRN